MPDSPRRAQDTLGRNTGERVPAQADTAEISHIPHTRRTCPNQRNDRLLLAQTLHADALAVDVPEPLRVLARLHRPSPDAEGSRSDART